jgi:hypothetical protein
MTSSARAQHGRVRSVRAEDARVRVTCCVLDNVLDSIELCLYQIKSVSDSCLRPSRLLCPAFYCRPWRAVIQVPWGSPMDHLSHGENALDPTIESALSGDHICPLVTSNRRRRGTQDDRTNFIGTHL